AISCFNDRQLLAALGAVGAAANAVVPEMAWARVAVLGALGLVIFLLSIKPTLNLLSPNQAMNAGFDPLGLVNTYGAFGSVTRERYEIVLEGTDEPVLSPSTKWRAYEFKGKPGDPTRRPPQVTPYHYKIDWQMWFAAMGSYRSNPWLLNLVAKLLRGDSGALSLIRASPFPEKPPRFIRAQLYLYKFASSEERSRGLWWHRSYVEPYLPPLSLDEPEFRSILKRMGWES
ncbi:MAG: lipase maturation factor family protein, partial [Deltaproteobacteria bacterium]|nr:lipase maturation factor family protein [Deltaproteobacteria bacterium]